MKELTKSCNIYLELIKQLKESSILKERKKQGNHVAEILKLCRNVCHAPVISPLFASPSPPYHLCFSMYNYIYTTMSLKFRNGGMEPERSHCGGVRNVGE